MPQHITHDPIYNTLDRDDFMAQIEVERYADRGDAFDGNRWNDLHYTNAVKQAARSKKSGTNNA